MRMRWEHWLLPTLLYYGVFFVLPQLIFVRNSLHAFTGPGQVGDSFTLANYAKLLGDPYYLGALGESVFLAGMTVVISLVLAVPVAYGIARKTSRASQVIFIIMFISSLTSTVIRGMGMLSFLNPNGPVVRLLSLLPGVHDPPRLTGNLTGAILALVHYAVPYTVLLLVPVIQAIEPSLEEAAAGLGASRPMIIRAVMAPLTAPGLIAASLLVFALSMGAYTTPAIVGGPRLRIYPILIYQQVSTVLNYALGSAMAFIMMVVAVLVVLLAGLVSRGRLYHT